MVSLSTAASLPNIKKKKKLKVKPALGLTTSISNIIKPAFTLTTDLHPNDIPFFEKKKNETGLGENDFTFNVVLPHDDLFRKKNFNEPYFTN